MWRYVPILLVVVLPACLPVGAGVIALNVAAGADRRAAHAEQVATGERARVQHQRRLHELWGFESDPAPPPPRPRSRDYGKSTEVGEWDH